MSTILKALKKLEEQSQQPPDVPRPRALRRRVPGRAATFRLPGAVWVLALTALIAALAVFGWFRWQDHRQIAPADAGRPASVTAPSPVTIPAQPRPAAALSTPGPALPQVPAPATAPDDTAIPKPPSQPRAIPADPALADVTRPPPPAPKPDGDDPGSNRPAVTVQAIAWSPVPANRIAVINGHVLHEGDGLGNIRVTRIEKNHVTLTENGRSWRVKFGR